MNTVHTLCLTIVLLLSTGNVYFTNTFDVEVFIEVMRLDGAYRKVLLRESQGQPRAVAVDPIKRYGEISLCMCLICVIFHSCICEYLDVCNGCNVK